MVELPLASQIEAVLFTQTTPVGLTKLCQLLQQPENVITKALHELNKQLASTGLRLSHIGSKYQLVTAPEASGVIARLESSPLKTELSTAALETLAIVAYKGPISIREISDLRGVLSDTMVRNLSDRGLIETNGRSRLPGGAPTYRLSFAGLAQFGLTSTADLPPVEAPDAH